MGQVLHGSATPTKAVPTYLHREEENRSQPALRRITLRAFWYGHCVRVQSGTGNGSTPHSHRIHPTDQPPSTTIVCPVT